jgi:multisubunit Na+/H+ antiporter MnhB subunit
MSPRFYMWLSAIADRDGAFVQLAGLALVIILAWLGVRYLPSRIQPWIRRFYMIGGVVLYFVTIFLSLEIWK